MDHALSPLRPFSVEPKDSKGGPQAGREVGEGRGGRLVDAPAFQKLQQVPPKALIPVLLAHAAPTTPSTRPLLPWTATRWR